MKQRIQFTLHILNTFGRNAAVPVKDIKHVFKHDKENLFLYVHTFRNEEYQPGQTELQAGNDTIKFWHSLSQRVKIWCFFFLLQDMHF